MVGALEKRDSLGQASFLAEASRLLASSLDYETTLGTVAGMALPHLGAWCFLDLREPSGEMFRVAVVHPDPDKQALARQLETDWPPARDDPFGLPRAMRTRSSEIIGPVTDKMLVEVARTEANLRILRELGIGSLLVVPLIARDEVLGAITFVSPSGERSYDHSDLALAEDLADRCAVAIDNARHFRQAVRSQRDAEEASRAKSMFLATMSHEIRTPINAVIGYADLLETGIAGPLTPDQSRYLDRIKASNRHLLGLINDVLDLAKADAGQVSIHLEEATARTIVDAALDMVRPLIEGRSLNLSDACEGDPDARFIGDIDRTRQIVVNLITNAIKFTADGGRIRISCGQASSPGQARVSADIGLWTYVRVEDTGIGIDPDTLSRLFEPFTQGETGYTRARQGTGLGLAISRRLARLMEGDLTVETQVGEGSTFTLWLPAASGERRKVAREPTRDQSLRGADEMRGVAVIGARLRSAADRVASNFVKHVREQRVVPHIDSISDSMIQDHVTSLIADLSQTLVLLEESSEEAADLLRDGSAIQRTIADRHGLQRFRIGWTESGLEAEFELLRAELEHAVRGSTRPGEEAHAEHALEFLRGFLHQTLRGSLRAFRMAAG